MQNYHFIYDLKKNRRIIEEISLIYKLTKIILKNTNFKLQWQEFKSVLKEKEFKSIHKAHIQDLKSTGPTQFFSKRKPQLPPSSYILPTQLLDSKQLQLKGDSCHSSLSTSQLHSCFNFFVHLFLALILFNDFQFWFFGEK